MYKKIVIATLCFAVIAVPPALAAPKDPYSGQSMSPGPRKQIATIIFAGLAGAVLGLSTLSFYGRPQDKLTNVPVGLAIGIITGTAYTTYKATTTPKDIYGLDQPELWRISESRSLPQGPVANFEYSWSF